MAKKKPLTEKEKTKEKVAAHRQRMIDEGYRQIAVQIPDKTIKKLDRLADQQGVSRATIITQLVNDA